MTSVSTQGNLDSARTELTGSIAHTHDELVVLQKRGERSYTEFDLSKSKEFKREGPFELRLKKANDKHQYADMELMVDDRNLSQKHVNLYQPVMFYTPDSPQPVEVVINEIGKDHIHGYVSASKYRQSELATMSNTAANGTPNAAQGAALHPASSTVAPAEATDAPVGNSTPSDGLGAARRGRPKAAKSPFVYCSVMNSRYRLIESTGYPAGRRTQVELPSKSGTRFLPGMQFRQLTALLRHRARIDDSRCCVAPANIPTTAFSQDGCEA